MVSDIRRKRIREQRNRETAILLAVFLAFDTVVVAAAVSAESAAETQQEAAGRCEGAAEEPRTEVSGEIPETETVGTEEIRTASVSGAETAKIEAINSKTEAINSKTEAINSKTEAETAKTEKKTVTDTVTETDQDRSLSCEPEGTSEAGERAPSSAAPEGNDPASPEPGAGSDAETGFQLPFPSCSVDGHSFVLAEYLYNALDRYGRADWFRYALCQCYQESRFDPHAVSADGKDKGLFQFREEYFEEVYAAPAGFSGADIWNPYMQIEIYAYWVNERLTGSADLYTAISDHYTGGYGYNAEYVHQVLQWLPTVEGADI